MSCWSKEENERKRLQALMDDCLGDMSDEDPFATNSVDDPDYQQSSDSDSDEENQPPPAKNPKICPNLPNATTSNTLSDSESSNSPLETEHDAQNCWGPILRNFKDFPFNINSGVPANLAAELQGKNELDVFLKIVTEDVFDLMALQTNIYAEQTIIGNIVNNSIGPQSRLNDWVPTDSSEMKVFLGIIIWMGLDRKPTMKDYWSRSEFYASQASKYMSRNRFEILLKMWHFSNNEDCPPGDRLFKIQSLVDILNRNVKQCMIPSEMLCIDESMVPFRGRISFRQYIKGKRHKFGFKLFKLCLKGGYTYHVKIYCGMDKTDGIPVANKVVLELMDGLLNEGRTLFTDNWYTSVGLAQQLLEKKTHLVGTLRSNRKDSPKTVTAKTLKKGEIYGEEKDGVVVAKWKDKRDILFLTTKHGDEMREVSAREGGPRIKPSAICEYNSAKSFIDVSDQMSSYSTALRRSVKWFRKIAVELLTGTAIVNAWLLFRSTNETTSSIQITTFRENLCLHLLKNSSKPQNIDATDNSPNHVLITGEKRARCKFCYNKNKSEHDRKYAMAHSKQVLYICPACPGKPPICVECFFVIHKAKLK